MLTAATLVLATLIPQSAPQGAGAPQPESQTPDVVRLDIGTEIHGTIVKETSDYVEIRLAEGMVVGFEKARAVAIVRGVAVPVETGARAGGDPAPPGGVADPLASLPHATPRDQWFALHDARGQSVGWLHETVARDPNGDVRFGEEWRFTTGEDGDIVEVTLLEKVDAQGVPETCFYHERMRDISQRTVVDRVVRGVVHNGKLEVSRKSLDGADRASYDFPATARFPLELRGMLRHRRARNPEDVDFRVYDPREGEWSQESYRVGEYRRIEHDGASIRVRTLVQRGAVNENIEWLDAASSSLRREISGPALVAVPMTEGRARAMARQSRPSFEPALAAEADGRFAIWIPNPMWAVTSRRSGEVVVRSDVYTASMSLLLLDQLDSGTLIETTADTVERWLRLAHADVKFGNRVRCDTREGTGLRMRGEYEVRTTGQAQQRICEVVVLRTHDGRQFSFCADLPADLASELSPDVERALKSLELRAESVAPHLVAPAVAGR